MRRNKYGNKKTTIDGICFDSKAEARRYRELKLLERAGAICDLTVQPRFQLQPGFTDSDGKRVRALHYVADFQYTEGGQTIVEDVKGTKTQVFRIKEKLFKFHYRDIELRVVAA